MSSVLVPFAIVCLAAFLVMRIDWQPGRYKILYHRGPTVGLKTFMASAQLRLEDGAMLLEPKEAPPASLPPAAGVNVRVAPYHGMRRMFHIWGAGEDIWFVVERASIGGWFVISNAFKGARLERALRGAGYTFADGPH